MAEKAVFKQKTVLEIMQQFFKDEKSKRWLFSLSAHDLMTLRKYNPRLHFSLVSCIRSITMGVLDFSSRVNPEGLALLNEVLRIFISEAANRAAAQAKKDGTGEVTIEEVEKILPELLLDL